MSVPETMTTQTTQLVPEYRDSLPTRLVANSTLKTSERSLKR